MASLRIVRAADLVRVPWRNGGGTTAEIAVHPPGAGFESFDWRISMADVEGDGPFSRFPGIDRTLVLAQGRDLVLDVAGEAHRLGRPGDALAFPGDVATAARLAGGPIRDINVMTRRGRVAHRLARRPADLAAWAAAGVVVIAVLADGATVAARDRTIRLGRLDMVLIEGACAPLAATGDALAIGISAC